MTTLQALQALTGLYNPSTSEAKRLRIKQGMKPFVFVPLSGKALIADLAEHEAEILARALYERSVNYNVTNTGEWLEKYEKEQESGKSAQSGQWLLDLQACEQDLDFFQTIDYSPESLGKVSKDNLLKAKDVLQTLTMKSAMAGKLDTVQDIGKAFVAINTELSRPRKTSKE